jgi:hypothetical protein
MKEQIADERQNLIDAGVDRKTVDAYMQAEEEDRERILEEYRHSLCSCLRENARKIDILDYLIEKRRRERA